MTTIYILQFSHGEVWMPYRGFANEADAAREYRFRDTQSREGLDRPACKWRVIRRTEQVVMGGNNAPVQ